MYARGAAKQQIFLDDLDRRRYLSLLARVTNRMAWRCLAYCLMGNHMHLMIETPQPNLGRGMQRLQGTYAQAFNLRHEAAGHVFGARYGSTSVFTDPQLWITAAYIARNPVEAGFCAAPDAWPWSSFNAIVTADYPAWLDAPRLLSYSPRPAAIRFRSTASSSLHNLKGSDPFRLLG
ncbi:transposase [Solirubrobacter deserti]|uniref:Transposase n=1 Tax=Solirubrobacter deserti TaxID=2282478 RepID=A0ABT4RKL6_9ACTN|nr:transposase [Solirubrobacter deserti]MDA0139040.1 transposase [Solirubrobacter deserti]